MSKRSLLRERLAGRKRLSQVQPQQAGLGAPTIMDRSLAEAHGSDYVHLAVFAIDVDRCMLHVMDAVDADPTSPLSELPFGWEVFLTASYVVAHVDCQTQATREMLESACLSVLDGDPEQAPLGSQLVFAVNEALRMGYLHPDLAAVFSRWRGGRKQLQRALSTLWEGRERELPRLALRCLSLPLRPPCAPPTLEALQAMTEGTLLPPPPPPPPAAAKESAPPDPGAEAQAQAQAGGDPTGDGDG